MRILAVCSVFAIASCGMPTFPAAPKAEAQQKGSAPKKTAPKPADPTDVDIDRWFGEYEAKSVTQSGDEYSYSIDVLNWDALAGGVIRIYGWQHDEELLCRVRERNPDHLEVLFEQHGPEDKTRQPYATGAVLLTLSKRSRSVEEWGAVQPIGRSLKNEPPIPTQIPQGEGWDGAYPSDFIRVPSIAARLSKLMGTEHQRYTWSLRIQSPVRRDGDLVLMSGQMNRRSPVRGGLAYDVGRDVIHAFICDPDCKERIDLWSEDWQVMNTRIRTWAQACSERKLPFKEHQGP